jgi:hypothetical protein
MEFVFGFAFMDMENKVWRSVSYTMTRLWPPIKAKKAGLLRSVGHAYHMQLSEAAKSWPSHSVNDATISTASYEFFFIRQFQCEQFIALHSAY